MQNYINYIHRLYVYGKITDYHLMNIILHDIIPCLCQAMEYYENLNSVPFKRKEKLLIMDFITTKFQNKE